MQITKNRGIIMFICLALIPISGFGTDLYAPSLPFIANALHASADAVRLSLSVFIFGFALGQLPLGTLSDHFGRRKMIWPFLLAFAITSLLAAHAKSIEVLLVLRFMQGIAAAGPSALSKAVLNDTFTGKEHTQVFSYLALCWGLSIVSAPFIGSYLQEYVNWQACFYALTLIGSLMFIVVFFLLPETLPPEERQHINFIGFWKRCAKVLANPIFLCCAVMNSVFYLFILIFSILGPFLIQDYWHYSALFYGRMALLMGVAWVAGTYSARMLVMHFTSGAILLGSVVALAVTTIANYYIAITWQNNIYSLIIPMLLAIYFSGIAFPGRMSCGMSLFPRNLGGTASSMLGVVTFLFAGAASSAISHIHPTTQIPWAEVMLAFSASLILLTAIFFALRKRYCAQTAK